AVCVPDQKHVQSKTVADLLGVYLDPGLSPGERSERLKDGWDVELPPQTEEDTGMFEGAGRSLWKEGRQEGLQEGLRQGRQEGIQEGVQQGRREGILQGKEEAVLENVRTLSARLHLSAEQAMDALDIPPEERDRIREKLLPSS
ncbi:MAG: hypothetical protein MR519_04875, partial [Spirochaetaceae bacterium]|nr:hypothetical protein [Spirochaetaceae bacterium]